MKRKILVDTSIWIEFFNQKESAYAEQLERLIIEDRVVSAGIILAELLQGAQVDKEYHMINDNMTVFPFLETTFQTWESTGENAFKLRRKGVTIPISDILIATLAKENSCRVFTRDKHFNKIPGVQLQKT